MLSGTASALPGKCRVSRAAGCYLRAMQTPRTRWRADPARRALKTLGEIKRTIVALADEDLLDLTDILGNEGEGVLSSLVLS